MKTLLSLYPLTLAEALVLIRADTGYKLDAAEQSLWLYAIGYTIDDGKHPAGCIIVSRPRVKQFDDGWTCEVAEICPEPGEYPPAVPLMYASAWYAAKHLAYRRMIVKAPAIKWDGVLKASGWTLCGEYYGIARAGASFDVLSGGGKCDEYIPEPVQEKEVEL